MTGGAFYPLQIRRRSAAYLRDKAPFFGNGNGQGKTYFVGL